MLLTCSVHKLRPHGKDTRALLFHTCSKKTVIVGGKVVTVHVTKAYWGSRGIAPRVINPGNITLRPLCTRERTRHQLNAYPGGRAVQGRSLTGIAGSNPAGGMDVFAVLYSKDERTSQDNQDKERSTRKVKRENERRNSEKKRGGIGGSQGGSGSDFLESRKNLLPIP